LQRSKVKRGNPEYSFQLPEGVELQRLFDFETEEPGKRFYPVVKADQLLVFRPFEIEL